jgi:hypothetical protein
MKVSKKVMAEHKEQIIAAAARPLNTSALLPKLRATQKHTLDPKLLRRNVLR